MGLGVTLGCPALINEYRDGSPRARTDHYGHNNCGQVSGPDRWRWLRGAAREGNCLGSRPWVWAEDGCYPPAIGLVNGPGQTAAIATGAVNR